jgi:WD40 repeat protein
MDNTVRVWDLNTGACLRTLEGHCYGVTSVRVTPDGRRAISGSWDETMRVWDLNTGVCLHTLEGHSDGVTSVSVTPDGRRAISSGRYDNTIRVWDLETGECLAIYNSGCAGISAAFSPSTGRIVCGAMDGQMHFLTPVNFLPSGPAILTAINPQKARCPVCGQEFAPPSSIVAAIQNQSTVPVQHSSLSTPRSAILSPCPHCAKPLQFNPFFSASS